MNEKDLADNGITLDLTPKDLQNVFFIPKEKVIGAGLNLLHKLAPQKAVKLCFALFTRPKRQNQFIRGIFKNAVAETYFLSGEKIKVFRFGKGPKVLLVHGWEAQAAHFYALAENLVTQGFEVITFDGPAHGLSSGKSTHALHFSDVIHGLDGMIGPIDHFIGHSFGGFSLALAFQKYPKLSQKKLVLLGSPNQFKSVIFHFFEKLGLSQALRSDISKSVKNFFGRQVNEIGVNQFLANKENGVLAIHDTQDDWVDVGAFYHLQSNFPQFDFLETKNLGHFYILRDPTVFKKIDHFLNDSATG